MPFSFAWDTINLADGSHTITAKSVDFAEDTAWSEPIIVNVDNSIPVFTGIPTEYHFELLGCDIEVIDMIPARDGISLILCGTLAANFADLNYNLVLGTNSDDVLYGTPADDLVIAFDGFDQLWATGGSGPDYIDGGADDDTLIGNDGADGLLGQGGVNHLYPGNGDDSVISHDGTGIGNVHYAPGPLTLPCWDMQLFGTFWTVNDTCNGSGFDIVVPADANFVTP